MTRVSSSSHHTREALFPTGSPLLPYPAGLWVPERLLFTIIPSLLGAWEAIIHRYSPSSGCLEGYYSPLFSLLGVPGRLITDVYPHLGVPGRLITDINLTQAGKSLLLTLTLTQAGEREETVTHG